MLTKKTGSSGKLAVPVMKLAVEGFVLCGEESQKIELLRSIATYLVVYTGHSYTICRYVYHLGPYKIPHASFSVSIKHKPEYKTSTFAMLSFQYVQNYNVLYKSITTQFRISHYARCSYLMNRMQDKIKT